MLTFFISKICTAFEFCFKASNLAEYVREREFFDEVLNKGKVEGGLTRQ
jgi:hypothetical protein